MAINVNSSISKSYCNVVIEPKELGKFTTFDLNRGKEIFEIGYRHVIENFKPENFQPNSAVNTIAL